MKLTKNLFILGLCLLFIGLVGIPMMFFLALLIGAYFKWAIIAIGFVLIFIITPRKPRKQSWHKTPDK